MSSGTAELYDDFFPMDGEARREWNGRRAKFVLNFDVEELIKGCGLDEFYSEVQGVIGAVLAEPEVSVLMPDALHQPGNIVTLAVTGTVVDE
jgi:hypothetical protein